MSTRSRLRSSLAVLCVTLVLGACGGEGGFTPSPDGTVLGISVDDSPYMRVSPTQLDLIARPERWLQMVHVGRRSVTFYDELGNSTAFIERVATDGAGRFSIEPVEAVTPLDTDWDTFHLRQVALQGFVARHRDFAIRDLELFQENWTLEELGYNSTVAGRRCDLFRARRANAESAPSYQLLIDSNGLLLAYREYDTEENLVSEMRYLSFVSDPPAHQLDEIIWYEPTLDSNQELDWGLPLEPQVPGLSGKSLFVPRWLPPGFAMRRASYSSLGEDRLVRLTYTDGVEVLLFSSTLPGGAQNDSSGSSGDGTSIEPPYVPEGLPDQVVTHTIGRTAAVQGTLRHRDIMALGKTSTELLLDLIQSSLP